MSVVALQSEQEIVQCEQTVYAERSPRDAFGDIVLDMSGCQINGKKWREHEGGIHWKIFSKNDGISPCLPSFWHDVVFLDDRPCSRFSTACSGKGAECARFILFPPAHSASTHMISPVTMGFVTYHNFTSHTLSTGSQSTRVFQTVFGYPESRETNLRMRQ